MDRRVFLRSRATNAGRAQAAASTARLGILTFAPRGRIAPRPVSLRADRAVS